MRGYDQNGMPVREDWKAMHACGSNMYEEIKSIKITEVTLTPPHSSNVNFVKRHW